jgi:predicted TIM-barrel fold metal-dependent hydrolase
MTSAIEPPLCLAPHPPVPGSMVRFPLGTVDTHFHVFDAAAPLAPGRNYTPRMTTLADWERLAEAFGIERGIVVQPSVYGQDNSVLMAALAASPNRLRGVVVIGPDASDAELRRMSTAGVRGVRINTRNPGGLDLSAIERIAARIGLLGWHLQFLVEWRSLDLVHTLTRNLSVPIVIDHFGLIPLGDRSTLANAVGSLRRLLDDRDGYVKLSAPYRLGFGGEWNGVADVVAALLRDHVHRLLWGSDWPHTELFADMPSDDALVLEVLSWLADPETRRTILVANPTRLFWDRH